MYTLCSSSNPNTLHTHGTIIKPKKIILRSLENETTTHSNILAWEIPWTEESDRLQSMGSQKSRTQLSD